MLRSGKASSEVPIPTSILLRHIYLVQVVLEKHSTCFYNRKESRCGHYLPTLTYVAGDKKVGSWILIDMMKSIRVRGILI